ncbi:MAG: hypothetical protein ACXAC7_22360, partial [Candidatus Hodarchaeales archaeon]
MPRFSEDEVCVVDKFEEVKKVNQKHERIKKFWWTAPVALIIMIAVVVSTMWVSFSNIGFSVSIGEPETSATSIEVADLGDDVANLVETVGEWLSIVGNDTGDFFGNTNISEILEQALNDSENIEQLLDSLGLESIDNLTLEILFEGVSNGTLVEDFVKNLLKEVISIGLNSSIPESWLT